MFKKVMKFCPKPRHILENYNKVLLGLVLTSLVFTGKRAHGGIYNHQSISRIMQNVTSLKRMKKNKTETKKSLAGIVLESSTDCDKKTIKSNINRIMVV